MLERGRDRSRRRARTLAAVLRARSDQPRLRHARGDCLRPAPLLRPAVFAERLCRLRRVPSARPQLHRQPAARARAGAGGSQRHRAAEPSACRAAYGWGGASDSLWMASLRPILDAREIGGSAEKVAFVMETGDGVACRYRAAFGADPSAHDAETVLVNVAKALAAYQETLVTGRTPFDDYRDALARGEPAPRDLPAGRAARAQDLLRTRQLLRLSQGSQLHRCGVSRHRRAAIRRPGDARHGTPRRVCRRCAAAVSICSGGTTTTAQDPAREPRGKSRSTRASAASGARRACATSR